MSTPADDESEVRSSGDVEDEVGSSRWMIGRAADVSSIGIQFGIATAIGYFAGRWLDQQFDTSPWLAIFLALCGIAGASIDLYKLVRRVQREDT